jgi:hypothetical protein
MLIGGVVFLLSRHLRACGARHLEDLLPTIHWYLLSYYASPAEVADSTPRRRRHAAGAAIGSAADAPTATRGRPA